MGAKNADFGPQIHFFEAPSKIFGTIVAGHQKHNFFVLTALHGGLLGGCQGQFLARKYFFCYTTPI